MCKGLHMIGAMIHITRINPPTTLAAAQNGVMRGDPMYDICAQSKVIGRIPNPDRTPNCSKG